MIPTMKLAAAVFGGAILGALAIHGLHAQGRPPVFQVTLQDISNPEALNKEFVPLARETIRNNGGKLVASGAPIVLEGSMAAKRIVINQWESVEKAQAWHKSADYQKARDIGNKYATFNIVLVEGAQ